MPSASNPWARSKENPSGSRSKDFSHLPRRAATNLLEQTTASPLTQETHQEPYQSCLAELGRRSRRDKGVPGYYPLYGPASSGEEDSSRVKRDLFPVPPSRLMRSKWYSYLDATRIEEEERRAAEDLAETAELLQATVISIFKVGKPKLVFISNVKDNISGGSRNMTQTPTYKHHSGLFSREKRGTML